MRILIFGLSSQLGGIESFLLSFSRKLLELKEDIRLDFIVFNEIPAFCSELESNSRCSFIKVPNRLVHPVVYRKILTNQLTSVSYDILWYNVCTLSDISSLMLAAPYVPHRVVHSHNSENMGTLINKLLHKLHKRTINKYATDYFACSREAAEFMFNESILQFNHVVLITNAIHIKRFAFNLKYRNEIREKYHLGNSLVVGHVGRFHPQKNHKFIIEVFRHLLKIEENANLVLIGEGSLKCEIKQLVEQQSLSEHVFFLEPSVDIEKYYSALDVFLFPSLYEGLGIAAIEAQTSGLPTLLSNKIPFPCKISNNTVFLSLQESAAVWAQEIIKLYCSCSNSSRDLGMESARLHGYDIDIEAERLLQLFLSLKQTEE